jgi:hypothetical protein
MKNILRFVFICTFVFVSICALSANGNNEGTLTVTNINSDFNGYYITGLVRTSMVLQFSETEPPSTSSINGKSMVLNVYQWVPGGDWVKFTGNTTINEGELVFILTAVNPRHLGAYDLPPLENTYAFRNRRAIIFTNGSATIDFSSMIEVDPSDYMAVPG